MGKESACNAEDTGDMGSIPGSERPPGIMLYVNYISIKLGKQKNTVEILSLLKELGQFFSWILREVS